MVIHEGFMAFLKDATIGKQIVFNSFWRYNLIEEQPVTYESICYETMVGWYHTIQPDDENNEDWGCFYAKKIDVSEEEKKSENHALFIDGSPVLSKSKSKDQCTNEIKDKESQNKLTWYRKAGMGAATAANYAAFTPDFGKADGDNNMVEISRDNKGKLREALGDNYWFLGSNPNEIGEDDMPKNFNWNNQNGISFFPPIRKQGCGDCYLMAFLNVFQSRIMIRTNGKIQPQISHQQQKDCNFYIEGCDGGLPMDVAKWGWEFQFVDEQCYKDAPKEDGRVCKLDLLNSGECDTYNVKDFYLVGGNYGGVSEKLIMAELLVNGPVTAVLNAPPYLQMYKGCILQQECANGEGDVAYIKPRVHSNSFLQLSTHTVNSASLWERGIEWEMVNHSIVIVGWGVDKT